MALLVLADEAELVDVEVEKLPLDVLVTLPLDVLVETLPLDEDVVETLPLEVDEVVETPPVEVELEVAPLDVEVEPPLVEVEPPLVEVEPPLVELPPVEVEVELPPDPPEEVEVELPPPVEVDVEAVKKALPLEPPKKPPEKKPPPKPPPKPPLPPTITAGPPPPPDTISPGGSGGRGIGAPGYVTVRVVVVVAGWRTTHSARCTRLARLVRCTVLTRASFLDGSVEAFAVLTMAGREGGFSATWTAPPPMIAPPVVQAHNLARAILTDIRRTLFPGRAVRDSCCQISLRRSGYGPTDAKESFRRKGVNHDVPPKRPRNGGWRDFRPKPGRCRGRGESFSPAADPYLWLTNALRRRFESGLGGVLQLRPAMFGAGKNVTLPPEMQGAFFGRF
ncbi:MAG: hypothetical protein ACK40O_11310 [Allosphingosinicella sp.]